MPQTPADRATEALNEAEKAVPAFQARLAEQSDTHQIGSDNAEFWAGFGAELNKFAHGGYVTTSDTRLMGEVPSPTLTTIEKLVSSSHKGLPVAGYKKEQPQWAVDLVNLNKAIEELALRQVDNHVRAHGSTEIDQRFVSIARTHLQEGFMALNRAVFQPSRLVNDGLVAALEGTIKQVADDAAAAEEAEALARSTPSAGAWL